jgi:hypothetical protein
LVKRARRSRGLPKDVSPALRTAYDEALEDARASIEDLADEYMDDLSIGEGFLATTEARAIDWDRRATGEEQTYRELLGPTFLAQLARIDALAKDHVLRIVFWFT